MSLITNENCLRQSGLCLILWIVAVYYCRPERERERKFSSSNDTDDDLLDEKAIENKKDNDQPR